ncbi:MAG: polyprenyl synthetase family protein, partial [Clostridia bacterium]|nr:polyprenyl synthetase family protein [Clostridia bacterium]
TLGKSVGSDAKNHKKTVLSFLKMNEAEDEETLLTLLAVEVISEYADSENLCNLALWLLSRRK